MGSHRVQCSPAHYFSLRTVVIVEKCRWIARVRERVENRAYCSFMPFSRNESVCVWLRRPIPMRATLYCTLTPKQRNNSCLLRLGIACEGRNQKVFVWAGKNLPCFPIQRSKIEHAQRHAFSFVVQCTTLAFIALFSFFFFMCPLLHIFTTRISGRIRPEQRLSCCYHRTDRHQQREIAQ